MTLALRRVATTLKPMKSGTPKGIVLLSALAMLAAGSLSAAPGDTNAPPAEMTNAVVTPAAAVVIPWEDRLRDLLDAEDWAAAQYLVDATLGAPEDRVARLRETGRIARLSGNETVALQAYTGWLDIAPDDPQARLFLAMLLWKQAREATPEQAHALLGRAVILLPSDPLIVTEAMRAAGAAADWNSVLRIHERSGITELETTSLQALLKAYRHTRRDADARRAFATLRSRNALDAGAYLEHSVWLEDLGDKAAALETTVEARRIHPTDAALALRSAQLQWHLGHPFAAMATLNASEPRGVTPPAANLTLRLRILSDLGCAALAETLAQRHAERVDTNTLALIHTKYAAASNSWKAVNGGRAPADIRPGGLSALPGLLILAYPPSIPPAAATSTNAPFTTRLLNHLDYLLGQGFQFVSFRDVAAARRGSVTLPPRSILLTFDGVRADAIPQILAVAETYRAPVLLAIATAEITSAGRTTDTGALIWETLAAVARNPLVEIASYGHQLSHAVQANPLGRRSAAATTRRYDPNRRAYESEADLARRVLGDLTTATQLLRTKGVATDATLVWPEGLCGPLALAQARTLGFEAMFGIEGAPGVTDPSILKRRPVPADADLAALTRLIFDDHQPPPPGASATFGMPFSLDQVYAESEATMRNNLDAMVAMVKGAGVDRVYLNAFADTDNNGAAEAAYFPTAVLPLRADLLNEAVGRIRAIGVKVEVRMPVLSLTLPDVWQDSTRYVMEHRLARLIPQNGISPRLSPFIEANRQAIVQVFADLAAYVDADGIFLMRDAFLTEFEDFGQSAAKLNLQRLEIRERNPERYTPAQRTQWEALKYEQMEALMDAILAAIRHVRPGMTVGRELFPATVGNPRTSALLSQRYEDTLRKFDRVLVDVSPELSGASDASAWVETMAERAAAINGAMAATVFRIDLRADAISGWLTRWTWSRRAETIAEHGGQHFTFGPLPRGPAAKADDIADAWNAARRQTRRSPR